MRGIFFGSLLVALLLVTIGTLQASSVSAHPLPGAIFTTLPDGSVVNGNVKEYDDKCDVALNGGPFGPQSHHLPDGDYDVVVTDPSGKTVLGVGEGQVTISNGEGTFGPTSLCDLVEPSPYDATPNHGGVYKVWLCESGELFVSRSCKTDNFKVRSLEQPPVEPTPTLPLEETPIPTPPVVEVAPTPSPAPVASSIGGPIPPETAPTPSPEPEMPKGFPDTGGEPPLGGNDVIGKFLLIAGGSILSLLGGFVAWRHTRFGFF